MTKLAALFSVDSFGSGLAVQTLLAYWMHRRFGADVGVLGSIFFATNVVAGTAALLSAPIARRFGLVNTMVWTHIPGNLLLIAFPFMPTLESSVAVLLGRFLVAQMDVPARTSYMMAIVEEDERSAASAITSQAKLLGASLGPFAAGLMGMSAAPFVVAGILKIAYDEYTTGMDPDFTGALIGPYDKFRVAMRNALAQVAFQGGDPAAAIATAKDEADQAITQYNDTNF